MTDQSVSGVELGRRRFVGFLVAAPTLAVAARIVNDVAAPSPAVAAVPTADGPADVYDLNTMLTDAALPTSGLITIEVRKNGTAHFALPRAEVGQGITTSTAMIIAEELDMAVKKVKVTLADARPELMFNQLTGGSNTTISTYTPIRIAAAAAKQQLILTAAKKTGISADRLTTHRGAVVTPSGRRLSYGSLAEDAAVATTQAVEVTLTPTSEHTIVGTSHKRLDAHEAVRGKKVFTMDLEVPGAKPTMVCRPPTLNGTPKRILNKADVLAMPGVTDVAMISTGVAVRARTFGQCIDAVNALHVDWNPGPVDGKSDEDILAELKAAEIPLAVPDVPLLADTVEGDFTFYFAGNSALETNCAVADVRADSAEVWSGLKSPITAQERIANMLGLSVDKVKVHVMTGGGSFGRKLFYDGALEAVEASKAFGKPVRLMWHRVDDCRQGRVHPMSTSRIRATVLSGQVLTWEQRHTSVATDFSHGLGEIITAMAAELPVGDIGFSQTVYELTQATHYNFGATTNLLDEVDTSFNTGSMRNIYSPNVAIARELVVDQLAKKVGKNPYRFRREFTRDDRSRAVLDAVAKAGKWGRSMPHKTAQGIAIHNEYHGFAACLAEIDCRPATVNRDIRDAVTGPRVTRVFFAVDVGLPINLNGLEAQIMGGIMDGIALTLTSSLHLKDGYFLEGSWDNYAYTREWNVPPKVEIMIMPPNSDQPGGAGEFGVAAAAAAVANAYARAMRQIPTEFPINHNKPLHFTPKPTVPPLPESPTNGLRYY